MRQALYILITALLLSFVACSNDSNRHCMVSVSDGVVLNIESMDSTPYFVNISLDSISVTSDTLVGTVSKNVFAFFKKSDDINNIALKALRNNNKVNASIKIGENVDTTFIINLEPLALDSTSLSIEGNCAKLISNSEKSADVSELKRWLFKTKQFLPDTEFDLFVGIVRAISAYDLNNFSVPADIPVVKDLPSFKIYGNPVGDYFALLACTNDSEISKFVEECVAKSFSLASNDIQLSLPCYKIGKPNGFQCICLICINKDWTYKIYPLGALMIDNIPPILHTKNYNSLVYDTYKFNNKNIVLNNYHIYCPDDLPKIASDFSFQIGKWQGYGRYISVPIIVEFNPNGDVNIIRIYNPDNGNVLKEVNLIGQTSPFDFKCSLPLDIGDNYYKIEAIDKRGNITTFKYHESVSEIENNNPNINIDNNVNVW